MVTFLERNMGRPTEEEGLRAVTHISPKLSLSVGTFDCVLLKKDLRFAHTSMFATKLFE